MPIAPTPPVLRKLAHDAEMGGAMFISQTLSGAADQIELWQNLALQMYLGWRCSFDVVGLMQLTKAKLKEAGIDVEAQVTSHKEYHQARFEERTMGYRKEQP